MCSVLTEELKVSLKYSPVVVFSTSTVISPILSVVVVWMLDIKLR